MGLHYWRFFLNYERRATIYDIFGHFYYWNPWVLRWNET
jgi:hypothetical protein